MEVLNNIVMNTNKLLSDESKILLRMSRKDIFKADRTQTLQIRYNEEALTLKENLENVIRWKQESKMISLNGGWKSEAAWRICCWKIKSPRKWDLKIWRNNRNRKTKKLIHLVQLKSKSWTKFCRYFKDRLDKKSTTISTKLRIS